jgi:hypothetical protein
MVCLDLNSDIKNNIQKYIKLSMKTIINYKRDR